MPKRCWPALNEPFIHRQTTANQVRFTTVELSELETRILNARDRALEIERGIFARLTRPCWTAPAPSAGRAALGRDRPDRRLSPICLGRGWCEPAGR
jgi:DNA mismatch repair protein MutS